MRPVTRSQHGIFKPKIPISMIATSTTQGDNEPTCFTEANRLPNWRKAMAEEFEALQAQGTWSLVKKPDQCNVIGSRWVYKLKHDANGQIVRYKARLVAKGYNQKPGIDFSETFSPVVKHATIRLLLAIALNHNWCVKQLDISNAFLHGKLEDTVYMIQPQGFIDQDKPHYVCKLHKALYGLKQAPRAWFSTFSTYICSIGFKPSLSDPSLFILHSQNHVVYLLVYVDDILIMGSSNKFIQTLVAHMHSEFNMKDLGDLSYFLGISISRTNGHMELSQKKYIDELLKKAGMENCSPCATPSVNLNRNSKQDPNDFSNPTLFRSLIGGLQYLTFTRPDIAQAVNSSCQKMHQPTNEDFTSLKRILRYLKGTSDLTLQYKSGKPYITAFCDANWASDLHDRKSTTGFCIFYGNCLVSWSSKKQPTVARSSTEAEYRSLATTTTDVYWLTMLLRELHLPQMSTPLILCDNIGAICLASNPVFHARTKHIELDYHFVREKVISKAVQVQFVSTQDNVADLFTKPLFSSRFKLLRDQLKINSSHHHLAGG